MAQTQRIGVAGLLTDPNPHVAVPEGALQRADEVVMRRVGVAEPRPGFKRGTTFTSSGSGDLSTVIALHPYRDAMLAVGDAEGTLATVLSGGYGVATETPGNLSWLEGYIRAAETRGNLYLNTIDAPRRITGVGADQTAHRMGAFAPLLHNAKADVTSGSLLLDDEAVSYRLVIESTDENGVVVYSQPSGRAVATNGGTGTRDTTLSYSWKRAKVGDVLQFYRSEKVLSATPADEHFLLYEIELSATSGSGTFVDDIPEERLGAPLYINDDEEGPDASNFRPPVCKDIALFQGSLFFANQTDYARVVFSRLASGGDLAGEERGIGLREVNATLTLGSNLVSGLSSTEVLGLQPGMIVYATASQMADFNEHPDPVFLVSINAGAGTATLSSDWNGATGAYFFSFLDAVRIEIPGGLAYYFNARDSEQLARGITDGFTDAFSGTVYDPVPELRAVSLDTISEYDLSSASYGFRRMMIEAIDASTTFQIAATHGEEYSPSVHGASVSTGQDVEPEEHPSRIGWSKSHEPEHYLLASFQDVGNSAPILRALPTRDALWILKGKGDGIYRLSGAGAESGFRIDLFDSSTYLLHPSLACVLGDVVYAWTNQGLVAISDAGVQPLSAPRIGTDTRIYETELDHDSASAPAFAVANPKAAEVVFALPDLELDDVDIGPGATYVLNTRTQAITRWFTESAEYAAAACHIDTRALWLGRGDSGAPFVERLESEEVVNADEEHAVTIDTVTDGDDANEYQLVVTVGAWVPEIGDLLIANGVYAIVTNVGSGGASYSLTVVADSEPSSGVAVAYERFPSALEWRTFAIGAPGLKKRWQEVILHWETRTGVQRYTVVYGTGTQLGSSTLIFQDDEYERSDQPVDERTLVPRLESNRTRASISVGIAQADARWQLAGMTLGFEPVSSRVSR